MVSLLLISAVCWMLSQRMERLAEKPSRVAHEKKNMTLPLFILIVLKEIQKYSEKGQLCVFGEGPWGSRFSVTTSNL